MSYELACFKLEPGADPGKAFEKAVKASIASSAGSEGGTEKQRLAAALLAQVPGLEQDEPFPSSTNIGISHTDHPLSIAILDKVVTLELPTTYRDATMAAALECMAVIEREMGYISFDPQVGMDFRVSEDLDGAMEMYLSFAGNLDYQDKKDATKRTSRGEAKRPWWKFW